jgi:hypothetical protein
VRGYYLIILAAGITSATLMLLSTYREYRDISQDIMVFLSLISSIITVYEFVLRRR